MGAMETAAKACPSKALFFLSNAGGKMALLAVVPKELQGKLSAKDWSNAALEAVGGKGGGNADRAQGQCPNATALDAAKASATSAASAFGGSGGAPAPAPKAKQEGGKKEKKKEGKKEE